MKLTKQQKEWGRTFNMSGFLFISLGLVWMLKEQTYILFIIGGLFVFLGKQIAWVIDEQISKRIFPNTRKYTKQ